MTMKDKTLKKNQRPLPTPAQLAWQDLEVGMFIHFGMFTYKDTVSGWEAEPNLFNPKKLDTDQWMEAAKGMGAKYAVLTAKHQDNFCLWPTEAYDYSVKLSKWRKGKGDVVTDFIKSCHKYGIKPGLYCCIPPKLNFRINGGKTCIKPGKPRWKAICEKLLSELWGNYGELVEVWFDSNALPVSQGGPDLRGLQRRLQPNAVVFGSEAASIRHVTPYEDGCAPYPCWCTVKEKGEKMSVVGDPDGQRWCPPECDTTIRNRIQWVWKPNEDHLVKSTETLVDIYYRSVGHSCNLLLNANPNKDGLIPDADLRRYKEFGREIRNRFGKSIAETSGTGNVIELKFPRESLLDHVVMMEDLRYGQRVRLFGIDYWKDGQWKGWWGDNAIGHKFILPANQVRTSAIRWRCASATGAPHLKKLAAYNVWRP
jgi:alpha-L-fucosidase